MIAQGSTLLNTAMLNSLTTRVNRAGSCAELQALATEAMESLIAVKGGMTAQLALLAPILALLTAPTSPTEVITWVADFITSFLTPYVVPYATVTAQLAELTTQVATLAAAMESKAAAFESCALTIPAF